MRTLSLAAVAALAGAAVATGAFATPASVNVAVGPQLQLKAQKTLGVREIDDLAQSLQADVAKRLAKTGAYDGARIELVLVDATPNRPTFKQLGDTPGLSLRSFGLGGAKIEGRAVAADGAVTALRYDYYASDIRWARGQSTWSDAEWAFDAFADKLGRGQTGDSR